MDAFISIIDAVIEFMNEEVCVFGYYTSLWVVMLVSVFMLLGIDIIINFMRY